MTIVSSEIVEDVKQAHDQRYVREKHIDHLGGEHFHSYAVLVGADVYVIMLDRVSQIETMLINNEITNLIGMVESGELAPLDAEPAHPETDALAVRRRRFFRKLLRYVVNNRDLMLARVVFYPAWYYLKFISGLTVDQIAVYLNVTMDQLQRVNNRFQAIHDNLAFIDADVGYLGEVE